MPDIVPPSFEEGKTLFNNRQYDDAIDRFRRILRQDPACSGAHHYLGRSLLEKQLEDEAVGEFVAAIRSNPSDGNSRYWLAQILLERGNVADARSLVYEAIRLEPGLLHRFASPITASLKRQSTFAETEDFLKNAAAILAAVPPVKAGSSDVSRSRAHLIAALGELYFSKGLLNGAMLQYRRATELCPEEPLFHEKLADIYFITNNDEDSVTEYRTAIARDPKNAGLHKRHGDALVKTRRFIDAFNEYREAVRLEPENEFFRKVYSQFRTLFIDSSDSSARHEPEKPAALPVMPSIADETFQAIIRGGENEFVEFKSSALWSKTLSKADIAASESRDVHKYGRDTSKIVIAKTIAGFLNTEGGNLVIGIRENRSGSPNEIVGIEEDYPRLRDPCADGYRRMLIDEIIRKFLPPGIFNHLGRYIRIHFMKAQDHTLCWLEIRKADDAVFVQIQDDDLFFIRIDAETRQITDKALVDYVRKRFPHPGSG